MLFLFTFALFFHFCNGIRHLVWDAGYGYELPTVERSAHITLVVSILLTVVTWAVAVVARWIS